MWADARGVLKDKPLRVERFPREWWWQPEMPRGKKDQPSPPSDKGVKMFELARFNIFTRGVNKAGAGHFRFVCMCWHAIGLGV